MCLGLGLEVYCLGLGLGLGSYCLGLGLGLGIYCLGHNTDCVCSYTLYYRLGAQELK